MESIAASIDASVKPAAAGGSVSIRDMSASLASVTAFPAASRRMPFSLCIRDAIPSVAVMSPNGAVTRAVIMQAFFALGTSLAARMGCIPAWAAQAPSMPESIQELTFGNPIAVMLKWFSSYDASIACTCSAKPSGPPNDIMTYASAKSVPPYITKRWTLLVDATEFMPPRSV